jgi:rSAM/selenodomain-associated transferase 1
MIVVKEPVAGQVKTRLATGVGFEAALQLYRAFIADTIALAQSVPGVEIALVYWPEHARAYFQALSSGAHLLPQYGTDLGERLLSAFKQAAAAGFEHCVVISSDSPSLPGAYLVQAFEALEHVPVVLGPCDDGGYYLIGMRTPQPEVFHNIAWSTEVVYQQTLERIAAAGLQYAALPSWYDIDTVDDLPRLHADLTSRVAVRSATLPVLNELTISTSMDHR